MTNYKRIVKRWQEKRINRATRRNELQPRNTAPVPAPPQIRQVCYYAVVTETISAKSGSTLGRGKGQLQMVTYDDNDVATLSNSSYDPTYIYHAGPTSIAVGRLIQVKVIGCRLHVDVDYCT